MEKLAGTRSDSSSTIAEAVFSRLRTDIVRGRFEPGEKLLLDLGCGWGAIAVGLALAAPDSTVWAVDVNSRARELTAENAARHRAHVRVAAPDAGTNLVTRPSAATRRPSIDRRSRVGASSSPEGGRPSRS